ncbi:hypothetical protein RHMOL_Rhmol06G0017300 [Rhododendron molle]|uniref:Uncharacterized protein n=1 Tax=Rhododendron molle TaxID=49168 RepID=A0ACC0N9B6_RHOML|nr:hypothetical protein RHMOL_Rhmol06G0017300 [Rhododendron molle]
MEEAGVITRSKTQPERPTTSMVSQASQSPSETRGKKRQNPKQQKVAKKRQRLTQESESEPDSSIQTQKQTRRKKQQNPKQTKKATKQESESEPQPEPHSPTQTQKQCTFRSNIIGTVGLLSKLKLNNAHLDLLKQTPFWMLIDAIRKGKLVEKACMKHDKPILSIIEKFDTNDSKFLIGGKKIAITRNDIKLIFGIACGNKPIGDLNKKKSDVAFATRRGIKEARIGSKKMKDMINEILQKREESMTDEDIRDVVRLVCMFICLTLFFSTSGVTIAWTYVHCMEKIEEIKDYDWAQSIAKTLNTSMHKFHDKPRDATGCVVALMTQEQHKFLIEKIAVLEKDIDGMRNQLLEMEKERDSLEEKLKKDRYEMEKQLLEMQKERDSLKEMVQTFKLNTAKLEKEKQMMLQQIEIEKNENKKALTMQIESLTTENGQLQKYLSTTEERQKAIIVQKDAEIRILTNKLSLNSKLSVQPPHTKEPQKHLPAVETDSSLLTHRSEEAIHKLTQAYTNEKIEQVVHKVTQLYGTAKEKSTGDNKDDNANKEHESKTTHIWDCELDDLRIYEEDSFLGGHQDSANRALDAVCSKILNTKTILIPIYGANHHTLLELDTIDEEWRFYNSIRKEGRRDKYCEATANLRKNVTNYINLHCKKKIKAFAKLLNNAPQQEPGSVDCAVVVAYIIRQKLMKKPIQSNLTKQNCLQMRADIVQAFLTDPKRSWTPKIYHNRMKNLRLQKFYDDQDILEEKKKQT